MEKPGRLQAGFAWLLLTIGIAAPACAFGQPASDPGAGAPARWFVPPPPSKSSIAGANSTVDIHSMGSQEDVTVTAKRRLLQRDPHDQETRDYQASHSDAASPSQGSPAQSYCQSAYQTVAGQAATGADMLGMGGGHCD